MEATTNSTPLQLDWKKADGLVTVTPKNQNRFVISARKAISALEAHVERVEVFHEQLIHLLGRLTEWTTNRSDISTAVLTLAGRELQFVVVRRDTGGYSREFEDSLSMLEASIAQDPDLELVSRLDALGLHSRPQSSLAAYINREFAFEVPVAVDSAI